MSWLQMTAGQGPDECAWVVAQVVQEIQQEAQQNGCKITLLEAIPGDQSKTMKSALLALDGNGIESFIKTWQGTIQWIGTSPYRPHHKRKNWFVGIKAFLPPHDLTWQPSELRIERMRSSGPGGQHTNKTESAIRITHLPTRITAFAQEERSQHLNRKLALSRLADSIQNKNQQTTQDQQKERWTCHITLERGNPVRVYQGEKFKRKR